MLFVSLGPYINFQYTNKSVFMNNSMHNLFVNITLTRNIWSKVNNKISFFINFYVNNITLISILVLVSITKKLNIEN